MVPSSGIGDHPPKDDLRQANQSELSTQHRPKDEPVTSQWPDRENPSTIVARSRSAAMLGTQKQVGSRTRIVYRQNYDSHAYGVKHGGPVELGQQQPTTSDWRHVEKCLQGTDRTLGDRGPQ